MQTSERYNLNNSNPEETFNSEVSYYPDEGNLKRKLSSPRLL